MKGGQRRQRGFTIVETMIVLAVTGLIFGTAVTMIMGKQKSAEFQQSIQDIQSQLRQIINEVGSGYYPHSANFVCSQSGSMVLLGSGATGQGTNGDCIFLGKAVHFFDGTGGTDSSTFSVYSMTGLRSGTDLASAKPLLIAPAVTPTYTAQNPNGINVTEQKRLSYGLTLVAMYYDGVPGNQLGSVAFAQSFGGGASNDGRVDTVAFTTGNSKPGNADPAEVDALDKDLQSGSFLVNHDVEMCFASGTTNQSGLITIGNNGNGAAVSLAIKDGASC